MANINFLENEVIEFKKTTGESKNTQEKMYEKTYENIEEKILEL